MFEPDDTKIVYERGGIFIQVDEIYNSGTLYIKESFSVTKTYQTTASIEWKPDIISNPTGEECSVLRSPRPIQFELRDLASIRRNSPPDGWAYLAFVLRDGTSLPKLHFHTGGSRDFISKLREYVELNRSPTDDKLYRVTEHDSGALHRSFAELNLFPDSAPDVVQRFRRDPSTTAWGVLSRVPSLFQRASNVLFPAPPPASATSATPITTQTPAAAAARIGSANGSSSAPGVDLLGHEKVAFRREKSASETENVNGHDALAVSRDDDDFEMVTRDEEQQSSLPLAPLIPHTHARLQRGTPLTGAQWAALWPDAAREAAGGLSDEQVLRVRQAVSRGGVEPTLRRELWKFLLGACLWNESAEQRVARRKSKSDEYYVYKLQWRSVTPAQEAQFATLRERRCLIEKDVQRTDRELAFFAGAENPNLRVLQDVLLTYAMFNFDLGYVQGMSDLLSPLLQLTENEADAFWCLAGLMQRLGHNFDVDQAGMKRQLGELAALVQFVDGELANHLESHEALNMYFCFRWLLVHFKREFSLNDVMRIWEVIWTDLPCRNLHLLICVAILEKERAVILTNQFGFTEILKHVNDLSRTMSATEVLQRTESLFLQLRASYFARLVQNPIQRSSYPQLRAYARYRPLPDELVHLFGFSEAAVRNDAGTLDADEYLQIARQLPAPSTAASASASSINRSRSPSPQRVSLLRQAPHTFSSEPSDVSHPAARTQFGQQTSGSTFTSPSDSALLAMRTPSPTYSASAGSQAEAITEKAALELLEATLRESEQQLSRDESAEPERLGSAFSTEHWLQDTCDSDVSSAFRATTHHSSHTRLYPNLSETANSTADDLAAQRFQYSK